LNFLKISSPFEFGADMISVAESRLIRSINCHSAVINRRIDPAFQRGIRLKDMQGKRSVFPAHVRIISWLSVLPFIWNGRQLRLAIFRKGRTSDERL